MILIPTINSPIIVEVVPGLAWKNLDTALMENCGFITFDNQPADNGSPPKHRDCKVVKLDPFDVKVAKSGGQSCQPGKECTFEFDIFNPGNIPHDDPVTVTDKLTGIGDAPIVSLTAASGSDAFPCNPPPTQAPFTCTGHMRLEVGEHNKYKVVIRIPADAPKSGAFTNCAGVGKDAAASTPGGTDDVCHTTKLEPPAPDEQCPEGWTGTYPNCTAPQVSGGPNSTVQDPVQSAVPLTGGPNSTDPGPTACFGGMILVSAGECRCPAPTILNGSTGTCVAAPDCPDGYAGEYPYCQLAPTLTGGSNPTTDSQERKDRRTSSGGRRGGGGPRSSPTGGTDSTMDSKERKDRRISAGGGGAGRRGGGGSRTPPANPPALTGGMNPTMQVPTGTKFCNGARVPLSFNCPRTQTRDQFRLPDTPRPPQTGGRNNAVQGPIGTKFPSSGPPRRIGKAKPQPTVQQQPTGTKFPSSGPPRRIGKAKPPPDKRVNYGASVNDNKNKYVPPE